MVNVTWESMVEHDGTAASSPVTSCRTSRPPDTPKAPIRLPMGMAAPGHHRDHCQRLWGTWAAGGARGGARRNGRAGAHDPPHRPDIHCIPGTQHHTPPWPAGRTHGSDGTRPIAPVEATASSMRARYAAVGGQYGAQLTARDAPCARRRTTCRPALPSARSAFESCDSKSRFWPEGGK